MMAAAAAVRARADVLDSFRVSGATAPERARSLAELGLLDKTSTVEMFQHEGIVRGVDGRGRVTTDGDVRRAERFFLDEAAVVANRTRGAKSVGWRVGAAILVALLLLLVGIIAFAARR